MKLTCAKYQPKSRCRSFSYSSKAAGLYVWVPAGGLDECLITPHEPMVNIELGYMGNGRSKTNLPAIINYAANIMVIALWPGLYGDFCPRLCVLCSAIKMGHVIQLTLLGILTCCQVSCNSSEDQSPVDSIYIVDSNYRWLIFKFHCHTLVSTFFHASLFTMIFCTYGDSSAVSVCAKYHCDQISFI